MATFGAGPEHRMGASKATILTPPLCLKAGTRMDRLSFSLHLVPRDVRRPAAPARTQSSYHAEIRAFDGSPGRILHFRRAACRWTRGRVLCPAADSRGP